VKISKKLSLRMAAVAAVAMLATTSLFADSRPSNETSWRGGDRSDVRRERERESRNGDNRSYRDDARQPYYAEGRISNVERHGSGYRVWVGGARYPFHVPSAHYHRDRYRPGLTIRIGGIFNVGGYYDYYDGRYDDRYDRRRSRDELRGYVERVDHRRDIFVMREERSGRRITVVMLERRERVRAGDYVEVEGDWSRSGVFEAYDVDQSRRSYRR
jgi:hypothetical protein